MESALHPFCWHRRRTENLNKGDVVIADVIHGYEYGKVENKTFIPRNDWTYKTDIGLLNGAVAHTNTSWQSHITVNPPLGNAIEQAQALGKAVHFMMIRGISDLPRPSAETSQTSQTHGTAERDAWKAYAADTAATFTVSYIAAGLPLPPR